MRNDTIFSKNMFCVTEVILLSLKFKGYISGKTVDV